MRTRVIWLSLLVASALVAPPASGAGELASPAAAAAPSALPELPRLAPIARPEADPAAIRELDRVLDQITSHDAGARESAHASLDTPIPGVVDAIRLRVQDIRGSLDRDAAPRVIADARKAARKAEKGEKGGEDDADKKGSKGAKKDGDKKDAGDKKSAAKDKQGGAKDEKGDKKSAAKDEKGDKKSAAKGEKGDEKSAARDAGRDKKGGAKDEKGDDKDATDGDWLDFALATPKPKESAWRDVVKLLTMERMLVAVGTTPAVRELIALHAYFGDLLRIDLQRQMAKLRDKAVPALIEARQHDAKIVQRWANKQLDLLGRAIPGEAIASNDTQILADILRAYGRTRDVDAVRVILSFCNSDRSRLRDAAREAISAIGEPGVWQLRDAYLNLTGNKPPREWAWDRIARELFASYDRARLAEVYKLMDEGVAAASAGKLKEATDAFDKVLARSPLFDRRKEMVKAYVERARSLEDEEALAMLRKALRLDPTGEGAKKLEAEIAYREGMVLIARGTPDKFVLKRALELDPTLASAREALISLEDKAAERKSHTNRYVAAGAVGFFTLLAMVFIARRRRDPAPQPARVAPSAAAVGPRESADEPRPGADEPRQGATEPPAPETPG